MVTATKSAPTKGAKNNGRIPESQAEAAEKEAAVDVAGKPHRIELKLPANSGFEAEVLIGVGPTGWWFSGELTSPVPGKSRKVPAGKSYETEALAVAAAFTELGSWLEAHKLIGTKIATKVRDVLAAVDAHQARILGKPVTKAAPAVPLADRVNSAPQQLVELSKITASADNMRKDFDPAGLQELANSIKDHGLEQPMLVRREGDGWDLIAGERRLRAGRLAKVKELPCRIVDCTPAEAKTLRMVENLKRRDLSAIEEAIGYQTLMAEGYTQAQVGEQVGVSQPTVANRLRLLKLPKVWQDLIIQREISESHARDLVEWVDHPRLLEYLATEFVTTAKALGGAPPLRQWKEWIVDQIRRTVRLSEPGAWLGNERDEAGKYLRNGSCLFTEKDLAKWASELQLIELTTTEYGRKVTNRYAVNVPKWDELQSKLQQEKAEREAKKEAKAEAAAANGNDSPDVVTTRKREQAEQLAKKIRRYHNQWIQRTAAARCDTMSDDKLMRLLIGFGGMDDRGPRGELLYDIIKQHGGKGVGGGLYGGYRELRTMMTVPGKDLLEIGRKAVKVWIQQDLENSMTSLRAEDLPAFVELFSIDIGKEWRLDEEYLLLHTKDQLFALRKEWGLQEYIAESAKRTSMIDHILADDKKKRLPAPKALLKGGAK